MKKLVLILVVLLSFNALGFGMLRDSVSTTYKHPDFVSHSKVWVKVDKVLMNKVIDDFLNDTYYNFDNLLLWGLKDMKLSKQKDKLIVFDFKSTKLNPQTGIVNGLGDVEVPGIITFTDIKVDSRFTKKNVGNKTRVDIEVIRSDAFLKKTVGTMYMTPINDNLCVLTLDTAVQFGWFFNIFITQPMYRSIMEWRFHKLLTNLRDEAEKRQQNLNKETKK